MTQNFEDFKQSLEYLVSIEPDPETCEDYDVTMAPFAEQIDEARIWRSNRTTRPRLHARQAI